jgi:diguanylate cyclase (GGDEF)-like protein
MAAIDTHSRSQSSPVSGRAFLDAPELSVRLEEEIHRAERHGTPLSCLLLVIENLQEIAGEHGGELPEQTLTYVGGALGRELRDFDRIGRPSELELLIVLPGADGPRGEIVARRVLDRMRTIKVEAHGTRRPLRVSVGLASWRKDSSGMDLLTRTRAAAPRCNGDGMTPGAVSAEAFPHWQAQRTEMREQDRRPPAVGRTTRS